MLGPVVAAGPVSIGLRCPVVFERFFVDIHSARGSVDVVDRLARSGIATFEGFNTTADLLRLAHSLGDVLPHRDSDAHGVTTLAGCEDSRPPRPGYLGFSSESLFPHTDGSSVANPPPLVMLACEVPARKGGAALVVDGLSIYQRLRTVMPEALAILSGPGSVRFGGDGAHVGAVFETVAADRESTNQITIRFRWDGLGRFEQPVTAVMPAFLTLIRDLTRTLTLGPGQGYVIQNGRWLHGRTRYEGQRVVHRILVRPDGSASDRDAIPLGFAQAQGALGLGDLHR
jgi:Taurine catabolism dioxygenase TauD, TfdA family